VEGGAGTVTNAGSISGYHGIALMAGGTVTNASGAFISGASSAIFIHNAAGTVTNAGVISATGAAGIDMEGGGRITNSAGGTVSGSAFGVFLSGGGTITNAGTISGGSYAVDFTTNAANLLVVDPGAVFTGGINGGTGTLELAAGAGSIGGIESGSFNNFAGLTVDAGANWTLSGTNVAPSVLDNGTIAVAGSLDVSAAVNGRSTGLFQIGSGATLEIAADTGTQATMSFISANSNLVIDNSAVFGVNVGTSSYAGPQLQNFVAGDTVDLKNFSIAGAVLSYDATTGVLQLSNSAAQAASLAFQTSSLGSGAFQVVSDGATGVLITHN